MIFRRNYSSSSRYRLKSVLSVLILAGNVFGNVKGLENNSDKSILDECPDENGNPKLVFLSDLAKYSHGGVKYEYLKMQCLAPYPIKWNFKGNKPNDIYFNLGIIADNLSNTTKRCYMSTLSSYKWSPQQLGRTGNYSCESLLDSRKISSVYKFMDGADSSDPVAQNIIFSSPRKVKVLASPNEDDWLVLPCASNTENVKATLWTVAGNGSVNKLPESISQHYDPKIGFLLRYTPENRNGSTNTSLRGNYLCHTTINPRLTDVVEINVLEAPEYLARPETETVTPINGHVFVACEANEPVDIEISNLQGGSLRKITSAGDNVASNYNYSSSMNIYAINEEGNISYSISGVAECKTKSNKVLHTWKFDTDHFCQCSWENLKLEEELDDDSVDYYEDEMFEDGDEGYVNVPSKLLSLPVTKDNNDLPDKVYLNRPELRGRLSCSNPNYSKVNFSLLHCGNENECDAKSSCLALDECPFVTQSKKINQTINGTSKALSVMDITLQSGILKCHVDGYTSTLNIIATLDNIYFHKAPENSTVIKILAPENKFVTGDKLIFSCEVEKYQLAEHLTWLFQFKNQSIKVIDDIEPLEDKKTRNKYKIFRTSYIKMSSADISALICSAPVWPKQEYKNYSFPLFNEDIGPSVSSGSCEESSQFPSIMMLRNSSISLNRTRATTIVNNYTVQIQNPVDQVKLVCRAPYPVQWIKDDELITTTRNQWSNCEIKGISQRKGKWYDSILEFRSLTARATGNYTCRKVSNHAVRSYVYLFASGNSSNTILEEGKHITVVKPLDDPDPWTLFPCRTASPMVTPYFFMDNSEKPKLMKLGEHLRYDATKGFSLDISSLSILASSYFYCSIDEESTNYNVLFSLHRPDGPIVFDRSKLYHDDNSKATFLVANAFLFVIIAILALTMVFLFRKHKENIDRVLSGNNHQMSSTYTASTENAVIDNDIEIGNGNYRRFS